MLGVKRGWLHSVFTRRAWRKRGLANALITSSLVAIRDRGMDTGILGVDADNPTGALGLYERNGFVVAERSTAWRKPFDSGRRVTTSPMGLERARKRRCSSPSQLLTTARQPGRVLAEHRGGYVVAADGGDVDASVSGRFRHEARAQRTSPPWATGWPCDLPTAANRPSFTPFFRAQRDSSPAPRRPPGAQVVAANVDLVLLVTGLDHDFNLRRLERYLALAWSSGASRSLCSTRPTCAMT